MVLPQQEFQELCGDNTVGLGSRWGNQARCSCLSLKFHLSCPRFRHWVCSPGFSEGCSRQLLWSWGDILAQSWEGLVLFSSMTIVHKLCVFTVDVGISSEP